MQENQSLINFMNQQVSNFALMYVKLHRYHWFVQGRHFFMLHEKYEEWYELFGNYLDEMAERVLAIGGKPLATMKKFLNETTLKEAEADDKEAEMLAELHADFSQIAAELKEGIDLCAEHEDEPSADLMIRIEGELEKQAWMIRSAMAYEDQMMHK
ncbi:MAG TPA: DNA starvation/stationary phase protection protein [Bacillales bacterium]|nr:DNA starvation/stationary phase protection protein [Bacillales bacterium]